MGFLDRFKRDKPMTEAELNERSQVDGIRFKELMVLGQLVEMGAEPTAPRHTLFYVLYPTERAANECADALLERGFEVRVSKADADYLAEHPDEPNPWTVLAESHDRALIPDFLRDTVDLCEDLATAGGGLYDGWEAGLTDAEAEALAG